MAGATEPDAAREHVGTAEPTADAAHPVPDAASDGPRRPPEAADPSLVHLFGRLAIVEARVRVAVDHRRASDPDPGDRFRGLYISEAHVDQLLAGPIHLEQAPAPELAAAVARVEARADVAESGGAALRLRRLAAAFGLDDVDVEILLVALAPDLDARFERLYAYLHDDVSRRRASVGLALELCGGQAGLRDERHRLGPAGSLVTGGLILVEDAERPFLTRSLRVPDRVTAHLLGDDRADPVVEAVALDVADVRVADQEHVARSLAAGARLVYVRERGGTAGRAWATGALRAAGLPVLGADLARLTPGDDPVEIAAALVREARLRGAALLAGPVEVLVDRGPAALRAFAEVPCVAVLLGQRGWDPAWSREVPFVLDAPQLASDERRGAWARALAASGPDAVGRDGAGPEGARPNRAGAPPPTAVADILGDLDPTRATAGFRLDPEQVRRAAIAARRIAAAYDRPIEVRDLTAGARAQNAGGLERLARRVPAAATWDDLILQPDTRAQLRELTDRARHREHVMGDWGMGSASRGTGVTALFAGDSGTGKTLSAEVVATDLGLDLYVIDLATVVDKYIGETEKNLDRIFAEADRVNGVLLFDEADAIFGKRSEVHDARDRYANVEIAYLLQRMERFDGLAVLTTNLRANLDEAFLRRLDVIVDFAMPEEDDRLLLWERHLPPAVPRGDDLDLPFLARAFKLSGGNIRNVCLAAAFLAATDDRPVSMADLVRATEREYQKLGRLTHEAEFGEYFGFLLDRT
jgi:AAA+ superfamily predicted ATPase